MIRVPPCSTLTHPSCPYTTHFRAAYSDLRGGGYDNRKVWGITNDTQITLGAVTIRNIFGYRHHENQNYTNTAGVGEFNVPIGPGGAIVPFRLLASSAGIGRASWRERGCKYV